MLDLNNDQKVIIGKDLNNTKRKSRTLVECPVCHQRRSVDSYWLKRSSHTRCNSCGQRNRQNIAGKRFDRLVAQFVSGTDGFNRSMWRCLCDCGSEVDVMVGNLTSGNTRS